MKLRFAAALSAMLVVPCQGEGPVSTPVLDLATGLPGRQAQLQWDSEPGIRYAIQKSTDLGAGGAGSRGWTRVAVVVADDTSADWIDPIPTESRAFYRIVQPQAEVFSIVEPVLSATGGSLVLVGQCIPDGSFLTLEIDGILVSVPLVSSGPGQWTAVFAGPFVPGGSVLSAAVTDGGGGTICPVDVDITITETGFAADAPPNSLPPAAPYPLQASIPVPGVGVVIKKHPGNSSGKRVGPGDDIDDDDDGDTVEHGRVKVQFHWDRYGKEKDRHGAGGAPVLSPLNATIPVPGVGVVVKSGKGGGKQHRLLSGGGHDCDDDPSDASAHRLAPGRNGMPGEACIEYDALTFVCPAGPPLSWIMSYRSMAEVSSGHGPGWDFAYNISIDASSSTATSVVIHDGAGRADTFRRAADGSYRADGFSRVGSFAGDVFTLTFANGGTWTFHALDGTVTSGKIETITDPNGNTLTCHYDGSGAIQEVEDGFGHDLSVSWSGGTISTVTDHTGRSVSFSYDGSGALQSIGSPAAFGVPPEAGATTFTYSSGTGTPRLDGNLLSITDGAGRVLESLTYAPTTTRTDLDFDTLLTQSAHELGHNFGMSHDAAPSGHRVVYGNDELGRVTETVFDRMHRPVTLRLHIGFHPTPGGPVSFSDFPLSGKTRSTDPDYYETTWTYNGDSDVTSLIGADGSKMLTTYERDLNPACAPIERGNARIQTLVSSIGEKRSITMEYEPNSGTPECARPGNPIGGLNIKVGKHPGGNPSARPGNPIGGLNIKVGGPRHTTTRRRVEVLKSNKQGDPDANRYDFGSDGLAAIGEGAFGRVFRYLLSGEGCNANGMDDTIDLLSGGGRWGLPTCDPSDDEPLDPNCVRSGHDNAFTWTQTSGPYRFATSRLTRLTTSHGQSFTWTYDTAGNCTSATTPISGGGAVYVYDAQGRLTSVTASNGADGSFHDELTYGPDGFLHTYTEDATAGGRNLTTTYEYDALGRCTRIIDPMDDDWLLTWSPLDVCTQTQSPLVAGVRIATDFTYDASGRLARCDVEHRDASGVLDVTVPAKSVYWVFDTRGRLSRVAAQERPVSTAGLLEPDPSELANFAVTDFTYDVAGQVIRASTPAACRNQSTDAIVDLTYDERGLLHHVVAGGLGTPGAVTTEYDYDTLGACVREACLAPDGGETLHAYDAFHRPASVTDAMGNEAVFTYDEAGRVTTSSYGELVDVPGSAGNVLLARMTTNLGGNNNWDFGGDTLVGKTLKGSGSLDWAGSRDPEGGMLRRGEAQTRMMSIKMDGDSLTGDFRSRRGQVKDKSFYDWVSRACPRDRPILCGYGACAAFFAVYQEDDVIETERFSPGSVTSELETTVLDRSPSGLLMSVTRNGDLLDSYTYDTNGALSSISNAARTVDFNRDGREDVVLCTVTNVHKVTLPPPNMALVHAISRDSLGRVTAVTDGAGNAHLCEYDSLGRVTSATPPGRPPVTFAYDGTDPTGDYSVLASCDIDNSGALTELGRALARCGVPVSASDSNGYQESYTYDALGRLIACDMRDGTIDGCDYDARGFVSSVTHQDGSITHFTTDALGRRIVITPVNDPPTINPSPPTSYAYDGLGRLVSASQGASTVTMTWDSVGNPTSETSNGLTVTRTFNHRGRASVTYPDSTTVSETRNEFGQLTNASGNLVHYVGMRVYQTVQANGVTTTYSSRGEGDSSPPGDASYGSCVRVTTTAGATTLSDVSIERSPDQLVTKTRTLFTADPAGPGRVRTYTYDGLGRVTACLTERRDALGLPPVTESDVHYTLDASGRRLSVTGGAHPGSYTQNATIPPGDHQMGQYTTWPGGALEWDDRGNLSLFTNGPTVLDLDSDGDGRLVAVNDGAAGTPVVSYTYDAIGRLASRTDASTTTTFVWDGSCMVQELDDPNGTGELSAALTFVCGDGGIRHCISTRDGTYYYPINTHARTGPAAVPRAAGLQHALTNDASVVLERYDHDEAGELLLFHPDGTSKGTAIGPVRWMAPESLRDASTGFIQGNGWTYSPQLGVVTETMKFTDTMGQVQATRRDH